MFHSDKNDGYEKNNIRNCSRLVLFRCDNFLEEYSQSQTVAKKVSHFDEVLLGDGYLPAQNRAYISTDHAGFLNIMDDDVTTVGGSGLAVFFWPDCSVNLFGYYAWQLEVGRNPTGDVLRDDSQTWLDFYRAHQCDEC